MSSTDLGGVEDLPEIDGQPLEEEPAAAPAPTQPAPFDLRASIGGDFDLGGDDLPATPIAADTGVGFVSTHTPVVAAAAPLSLPSFAPDALPPTPPVAAAPAPAPVVADVAALTDLANEKPKSSQENLGDLLGEMDFDLPPPPAGGAATAPVATKPALVTPSFAPVAAAAAVAAAAPAPVAKPGVPSFEAFKAPSSPFGKPAAPGASPLAMPVPPVAAAPVAPVVPSISAVPAPKAAAPAPLRAALAAALQNTSPATAVPAGGEVVVWNLARVLVAKGIVSIDELLG